MSVHLGQVAADRDIQPRDVLPQQEPEKFGMVSLGVGLLYELEQVVLPDPEPLDPTHAVVVGAKTTSRQRRMSREASTMFYPDTEHFAS